MASKGRNTKITAGTVIENGACIVIVKTEWNSAIVDELEAGAVKTLEAAGVDEIITLTVPGAVEIPFAIRQCWEKLKYRDFRPMAFIALGTVIQGDTPHFDYVCQMVADGVLQLNLSLPVPVIFGVLTVNTTAQALERIGGIHGHKGEEAADAALKMISLGSTIDQISKQHNLHA
jgi:6,7-dimethyl-8-ribityllumazine synthase